MSDVATETGLEWRDAEGRLHREDGPAASYPDGRRIWFLEGEKIRERTSSVAATIPGAFQAVYNASKSFVHSLALTEEKDDPAEVARQGFDALMAGKERVVGGSWKHKAQVAAGRFVPDKVKAEMHRKMAEPGTGEEG